MGCSNTSFDRLPPRQLVCRASSLSLADCIFSSGRRVREPVQLGLVGQKLGASKDELSGLRVVVHADHLRRKSDARHIDRNTVDASAPDVQQILDGLRMARRYLASSRKVEPMI